MLTDQYKNLDIHISISKNCILFSYDYWNNKWQNIDTYPMWNIQGMMKSGQDETLLLISKLRNLNEDVY